MDELIDIVDENGASTGKTALKSEAHKNGWFHNTAHIWLFTRGKKILLQKRAMTKKVFPGLWDISVAGHIGAGESIVLGAKREVEEELGLFLNKEKLIKIGTRKHQVSHKNGIIDHEFHHIFIAELKVDLSELTIQKEEVDKIQLFDLDILLNTKQHKNVLLPEFHQYYKNVYYEIVKQLYF